MEPSPDLFEDDALSSPGLESGVTPAAKRQRGMFVSPGVTPCVLQMRRDTYPETPRLCLKPSTPEVDVLFSDFTPVSAADRPIFPDSEESAQALSPRRESVEPTQLFPSADPTWRTQQGSLAVESTGPEAMSADLLCSARESDSLFPSLEWQPTPECTATGVSTMVSVDLLAPPPAPSQGQLAAGRTPRSLALRTPVVSFRTPFPSLNVDVEVDAHEKATPLRPADRTMSVDYWFASTREAAMLEWSEQRPYLMAQDFAENGTKGFCAVRRAHVNDIVLSSRVANRCFYSVVPPDVPVDIYLDIDYKRNPEESCAVDKERLLLCVLDRLAVALRCEYNAEVQTLVVLEATTPKKISFHVHASMRGKRAFPSACALQRFLKCAYATTAGMSEEQRLAFDSVDIAPYGRFACFRLPCCAKKGKRNALVYVVPSDVGNPELRSLLLRWCPSFVIETADVIDLCLITTGQREVIPLEGLHRPPQSLDGGVVLSRVIQGQRRRHPAADADLPHMQQLRDIFCEVFTWVHPKYCVLRPADLKIKSMGAHYIVSQTKTAYCVRKQATHTSAHTYLKVSRYSVLVCCWSSKCQQHGNFMHSTTDVPCMKPEAMQFLFDASPQVQGPCVYPPGDKAPSFPLCCTCDSHG
eukprot:TRINITY_DN10457_c0_g1_i1.p1 TRINITY_DN10457_c0_g1~~TRINITY_DN10457_c0_g1_i1.p1  ORF type:complete len:653 (+),score=79.05 TRINITY_DN10457_c0_g1_i1:40-1959(+)